MGRGGGRARPGPELEARDRGVRSRPVRQRVQRSGVAIRPPDNRSVHPSGHVDGLGQLLLHLQRREHRAHLALPQDLSRARLDQTRRQGHALVHEVRHKPLPARACGHRYLPRDHAYLRHAAISHRKPAKRVPARMDDDTVDAGRKRRCGGTPRDHLRKSSHSRWDLLPVRERRRGDSGKRPRSRRRASRSGVGRIALPRPVGRAARSGGNRPHGRPLGGRLRGRGHRNSPHSPGLRRGGLRACRSSTICPL